MCLSANLAHWQAAQATRLKHLQFHFTPVQLDVVQQALSDFSPSAADRETDNPNRRSVALFRLCQDYLAHRKRREP